MIVFPEIKLKNTITKNALIQEHPKLVVFNTVVRLKSGLACVVIFDKT